MCFKGRSGTCIGVFIRRDHLERSCRDSVSSTTIDDTDSRIVYAPSTADWQVDLRPGLNMNDTLQFVSRHVYGVPMSHILLPSFTEVQGASATIPFSGDAVAVYGSVSPNHADILVSLDGQTSTVQRGSGVLARTSHTKVCHHFLCPLPMPNPQSNSRRC